MNKEQTLEAINRAKIAHMTQMEKIKAAIDGEKVNNPTAVVKTACDFGKWIYSEESHLKKILGSLFYDNLEVTHGKWHSEYVSLFNILFKDEKKGFFSKFIGSSAIDEMEMDKAKLYYSELEATTAELLRIISSCERRVNAMNELKFT